MSSSFGRVFQDVPDEIDETWTHGVLVGGGSDVPDAAQGGAECYAWHFFFRHGGGKKWKKQYDAYFDSLRANGDAWAAAKAFDGADFAAMAKEFKEWASKWEP